jgi:hypothetical protein
VAGHDALYSSSSAHRIVIGTEFYFMTLPPPQHSNRSLQIPSMNKCANLGAIQNSFSYSKTSFLQGLFSDRTLTRSALGPSAHGVDSEWSAVCVCGLCYMRCGDLCWAPPLMLLQAFTQGGMLTLNSPAPISIRQHTPNNTKPRTHTAPLRVNTVHACAPSRRRVCIAVAG